MATNMLTLSGASNFVLLGRTAHTSHDEITNHLVQAFCLTTFLRADVSCFGDITNAINAGRRGAQCISGIMHAAGLQVCTCLKMVLA